MYPEAGGSSSFARHAFNEFWSASSPPGGRCSTTRSRSRSRPSSCPTTWRSFWAPLRPHARRHHRRRGRDRGPGADQHPRHRGVGEAEPGPRGRRPRHPGRAGRDRPGAGLQPAGPGRQHPPRRRPDLERLRARDRGRDDRLHRDRDDLQHGRGGQGRGEDDPDARSASSWSPCSASTCCSRSSPSRRCRSPGAAGHYTTRSAAESKAFADDPILGIVENLDLGPLQHAAESTSACWPR